MPSAKRCPALWSLKNESRASSKENSEPFGPAMLANAQLEASFNPKGPGRFNRRSVEHNKFAVSYLDLSTA